MRAFLCTIFDIYAYIYINYLRLAEEKLKKGSIIVADNAIMFKDKMQDYLNYQKREKKELNTPNKSYF